MGTKLKIKPCPNCRETVDECACMRNKCKTCGEPVGNITFTACDDCWDKKFGKKDYKSPTYEQLLQQRDELVKDLETIKSTLSQGLKKEIAAGLIELIVDRTLSKIQADATKTE